MSPVNGKCFPWHPSEDSGDAAQAGPLKNVKVSARTDLQILSFVLPQQNKLEHDWITSINWRLTCHLLYLLAQVSTCEVTALCREHFCWYFIFKWYLLILYKFKVGGFLHRKFCTLACFCYKLMWLQFLLDYIFCKRQILHTGSNKIKEEPVPAVK